MVRMTWLAAVSVACGFVLCFRGSAEPPWRQRCRGADYSLAPVANAPGSAAYAPLHYWAPTWIRVRDCLRQPRVSSYMEVRPDIAPTYQIIRYPCPAVDPAHLPYGAGLAGADTGPSAGSYLPLVDPGPGRLE